MGFINKNKMMSKYLEHLKAKEKDDIVVFYYLTLYEIGKYSEEELIKGLSVNSSTNYNMFSNINLIDKI